MKEEQVRALIEKRLRTGSIPHESPTRTYAGPGGGGATCDCCGSTIGLRDVEYEVDFVSRESRLRRTLVMHMHCHAIWSNLCSTQR